MALDDIWDAAKRGDAEVVQYLIENGDLDVNEKNQDGDTLLSVACSQGFYPLASYLIGIGANVNIKGRFDFTPLHFASEGNHIDIVRLLLEHNADVNTPGGGSDYTALHIAILVGHYEIVQMLVENGADVNIVAQNGERPIHVACREGRQAIIEYLLNHEADVNAPDKDGITPLHWAYWSKGFTNGNNDTIAFLILKGADKRAKDKFDRTPPKCEESGKKEHKIVIEAIE